MLPLLENTTRTNTKEQIQLHGFLSYYVSFVKKKKFSGYFLVDHLQHLYF